MLIVLIPFLNLAGLLQPFHEKVFRKGKLKFFDLQLLPGLPVVQEVGWPVRDTLKNNIRLPETGRTALIMFKPTTAGDACKA